MTTDGRWDPGKDFAMATSPAAGPVPKFMSIWRSPKPVIAQVHGWCVGGGSDMALCADLVIASDDARIGTPYSRMWGCYLTGMWLYRLGLTKRQGIRAHGPSALRRRSRRRRPDQPLGAVRRARGRGRRRSARLAAIPLSQLTAMKLVVNQAYENMGLASTQTLGPILDGLMRNTPDAEGFIELAEREGVGAAVARRDGPFGDYSQAPDGEQPNPDNVIEP